MDALLLEQHLRSPLRIFPDPMMAQLMPGSMDSDGASAALLEKARQHLQMWGRSPYTELLLPQMYQRPNINAALNLGLWQGQWSPQLSAAAGFLNNQAALQQAAAVAQHQQQQQQQQTRSPPPLPPPISTPNSSGSPSPDMRSKHFATRFSPYQLPLTPQTQISPQVVVKPPQSPPDLRGSSEQ
jgi:T-box protein 20